MATFKERLFELQEEAKDRDHKLTRFDYAEVCEITKGQLDGYLKGNGSKFCEILVRIAKNNNVSVAWLIGGTDNRIGEDVPLKAILNKLSARDLYTIQQMAEFLLAKSKK